MSVLLLLSGCGRQAERPEALKEYRMRGVVVGLDPQRRIATIKHEKIDGWMDAMTMQFPVKDPRSFERLRTGMKVRAKVLQRPSDFDYWLEEVESDSPEPGPSQ